MLTQSLDATWPWASVLPSRHIKVLSPAAAADLDNDPALDELASASYLRPACSHLPCQPRMAGLSQAPVPVGHRPGAMRKADPWTCGGDAMSVVSDGPAVWVLDLQRVPDPDPALRWHAAGLVSDEELVRARRFRHALARSQHLAGRAVIRHAVGVRAHCRPDEIGIVGEGAGKPRISLPSTAAAWHFNLSHSGNFIACVVDRLPVGIDVETVSRNGDIAAIAGAHFSAAEARWIGEADARGKDRFTALWTLKEAFLKAVGVGISVPLSGIVFSALRQRTCLVQSRDLPEAGTWHCSLISLQRGYWLSVCSRRPMGQLQIHWTEL